MFGNKHPFFRALFSLLLAGALLTVIIPGCSLDLEGYGCIVGANSAGNLVSVRAGGGLGCTTTVSLGDSFHIEDVYINDKSKECFPVPLDGGGFRYIVNQSDCVCDLVKHTCEGDAPSADQYCAFTSDQYASDAHHPTTQDKGCELHAFYDTENGEVNFNFLPISSQPNQTCSADCTADGGCDLVIGTSTCNCSCPVTGDDCTCEDHE